MLKDYYLLPILEILDVKLFFQSVYKKKFLYSTDYKYTGLDLDGWGSAGVYVMDPKRIYIHPHSRDIKLIFDHELAHAIDDFLHPYSFKNAWLNWDYTTHEHIANRIVRWLNPNQRSTIAYMQRYYGTNDLTDPLALYMIQQRYQAIKNFIIDKVGYPNE